MWGVKLKLMDTDSKVVAARGKGAERWGCRGPNTWRQKGFDLGGGHTVQYTDLVS